MRWGRLLVVWLLIVVAESIHGTICELYISPVLGDLPARQLGVLIGSAIVFVIAVSRFGYLRTPLPEDATAEAQADAHACLLDGLGISRAAVLGASSVWRTTSSARTTARAIPLCTSRTPASSASRAAGMSGSGARTR